MSNVYYLFSLFLTWSFYKLYRTWLYIMIYKKQVHIYLYFHGKSSVMAINKWEAAPASNNARGAPKQIFDRSEQ
jgi:hypothetical protein